MQPKVEAGDYAELIRHLARAREYPIAAEMQSAITEQLRAVPWSIAYQAVCACLEIDSYNLRNHLYKLVCEQIESLVLVEREKEKVRGTASALPSAQHADIKLSSLWMQITAEIHTWVQLHLMYNNKPVVVVENAYSGGGLDDWIAAGRPATFCVLNDVLLDRYEKALAESADPKEFLIKYLTYLRSERRRQLGNE